MTGLKAFNGMNFNYESHTYFGQKAKMVLVTTIPSKDHPSISATNFLNSFNTRITTQNSIKPYVLNLDELRGLKSISQIFVFPENSLEFTVNFPEKPNVENVFVTGQGVFKAADLALDNCFLRAEHIPLSDFQIGIYKENQDDKTFAEQFLKIAERAGWSEISVSIGKNEFGRFARMRGHKIMSGVNFQIQTYILIGQKAVISLTVGAPVKDFPTVTITKFLNSLKHIN